MPTKSPLPVLAKNVTPLPKLVGPVYPLYRSTFPFDGPIASIPKVPLINSPPVIVLRELESQSGQVNGSASGRHNVGPDLLQRYAVSLGGLDGEERRCNCGEHQRAANRCEDKCFHSNLRFGTNAKRLLPIQARHWESPVVRTHRGQVNRREKRSLKSITKFTYFAVVPTARWSE